MSLLSNELSPKIPAECLVAQYITRLLELTTSLALVLYLEHPQLTFSLNSQGHCGVNGVGVSPDVG